MNRWNVAKQVWLATASRKSIHTFRSYKCALMDFEGFIKFRSLEHATSADVAGWANDLAERGLAPSTINTRLAALSSFYQFCITVYTDENGEPLADNNPVDRVDRPNIQQYGHSHPLTQEQVAVLLAAPDRATVIGARDYALLLFAVYTGKRSSEIRNLRAIDIQCSPTGSPRFFWRGKRGKTGWSDLPTPVWQAIQLYWAAAGREPRYGDPVFVAHNGRESKSPLSSTYLNMMVQKYAQHAGFDWVTFHTLRHTAANLRLAANRSVIEINQMLGHARLETTQIYLEQLTGFEDSGWQKIEALLADCSVQSGKLVRSK